ncbi:MAG: helix-turn-helix domain-containing protein [Phycisphaerae bacterium]|jgi:transcriptional regulator with XRE-family HTH domain|nr:helix-turn-helix domain-containing protein [Phycisphaerae bacterium]
MANKSTGDSNEAKDVGQVIREARQASGLTYEQLAEQSGCFETTIEKIELGEIRGDREQLQKLAGVLGLDPSELFALMLNKPKTDPQIYSGSDVRRARKAMGLTQQQLAALADCCGRTVSSFELGKNRPQRRVLNAIVKVLGEYLTEVAPGKVAEAKSKTAGSGKGKGKRKPKLAPPAHIGEKIKRAREAKGISQEQLAEMIGAYPYTIAWIERGKERPTPELEEAIWEAVESDLSKPEPKAHRGDTSHIFTSGKNLLRDLFGDADSSGDEADTDAPGDDTEDARDVEDGDTSEDEISAVARQLAPEPVKSETSDAPAANIAQAVKQARMRAGLTPQALSQLVPSCSSGLIAYIEVGFKKPTPEIAKALAIAMNVDPEEFLAFLD